jgi:hypothetical protein
LNLFYSSIRYGIDIGRLNIYLRSLISSNFTTESLVWVLSGQQGNNWNHGFVPIQPNGRYQIIIEGISGRSFEGDIAVDDIGISPTDSCALQPVDASPVEVFRQAISCGFQDNLCQWEHDPTGKFNWTRHTESTPSIDTGPSSGRK